MPLLTPQYDFHRIEEIPTDFFIRHGICALLLDVDNTLTGDNSQEIKPEVMDWLERQRAAGLRLFVISNNHELRVAPFANRLGLGYIADAAKPKKKVALAKMKEFGVSPRQTALIGDQLFTDVWGAKRAGMHTILVKPIHPKEEIQIVLKRYLEKIVLYFYKKDREKE